MVYDLDVDLGIEIDPAIPSETSRLTQSATPMSRNATPSQLPTVWRWPGLTVELVDGGNHHARKASGCMALAMTAPPCRTADDIDPAFTQIGPLLLMIGPEYLDLTGYWPQRFILVMIDSDLLASVDKDVFDVETDRIEPNRLTLQDPLLSHIMISLYDEHRRAEPGEAYILALGRALVAHLIHCHAFTKRHTSHQVGGMAPRNLRRVTDYIDMYLEKTLDLNQLADIAGLSPWHFLRAFKKATGKTPHRFVMERRVLRAKNLLDRNEHSILDIALAVGCVDHSHFSRVFRRATGMTPSAYRRSKTLGNWVP